MRIIYPLGDARPLGSAVVALGTFDGVHMGHRRLAEHVAARAGRERALAVAAVRWEGETPDAGQGGLLTLLDERLALLRSLGHFDAALVLSQAPDVAPPSAEGLLAAIGRLMDVAAVVPDGEDGPVALAAASPGTPVGGTRIEWLEHDGGRARTTSTTGVRIAELLRAGDIRGATLLLGHPYGVRGEVVSGDRRGRVLGYPTANLRLDPRKILPADGIYAVRARLPGEAEARHPAVVSLGVRPQFGSGKPRLLEVFLLDAALDLYGLPLAVEFVERLREERRFANVEGLLEQMARDVALARTVLSGHVETEGGGSGV